ncbi:MAG: DUF1513 domain-containing protein [Pseudomonadota bacterium]
MADFRLDRRAILKASGAFLASHAMTWPLAADETKGAIFASAFRDESQNYGVLLLSENGEALSRIELPDRGHDLAFDRVTGTCVAFARRPGLFAVAFDVRNRRPPILITASGGRHFYGHGAFSRDGKRLYASENDYEKGSGVIGVYDAAGGFLRIGEFPSFGTGPHEVKFHPSRNVLVVANGGIETHPEFGRAKLNLPTMQPSICFIDPDNGALIEKYELPQAMHQLSIRHLDVGHNGTVYFGCQNESDAEGPPSLFGEVAPGKEISLWPVEAMSERPMGHYVGSVALSADQCHIAFTLPKSNQILIAKADNPQLTKVIQREAAFGVSAANKGFVTTDVHGSVSSLQGNLVSAQHTVAFDNHIARL